MNDSAESRLKQILKDLETVQLRIAELSDELDSDTLEKAELDIDYAIDHVLDAIEENGWGIE